ncbi:TadE family protein [Actinoallomurus rhizosphaericola]|uniref:TadE family protein n=1 Tax=Actinoallomurus rhizosphaericola TaxID=2952536 RepID=UPI002092E79B|nr:TadE family protein [Actinoallomurus rhizosphaericola]MCO5999257.1 pilus assembly protein [Actinoallomurus rhizosphaericola]
MRPAAAKPPRNAPGPATEHTPAEDAGSPVAVPDRGTMALEMAILTPLLVAFMMLMVGLGRIVEAHGQVDGAARDAARAASVARDRVSARSDAEQAAQATLSGSKRCRGGPRTEPDFRDWRPGGQVTVTVRCDIDLGGLSLIGLAASRTMVGTATAPLDTLRRID